jgi:hypothetical protein
MMSLGGGDAQVERHIDRGPLRYAVRSKFIEPRNSRPPAGRRATAALSHYGVSQDLFRVAPDRWVFLGVLVSCDWLYRCSSLQAPGRSSR